MDGGRGAHIKTLASMDIGSGAEGERAWSMDIGHGARGAVKKRAERA